MKYKARKGIYEASNVSFNPDTCEAFSYGWWKFVRKIPTTGKIVFNDYNYSNTTRRHQQKVRRLLDQLGVRIDIEIDAPKGLSTPESAISFYRDAIDSLQREMAKRGSRKAKNRERFERILQLRSKIAAVNEILHAEGLPVQQ